MITKEEIIKESQKIAIEKGKEGRSRGDVFEGARDGATWANDQNAARIAELEAMLSKSAFDLDGHIILLQAANQQIEKERKRIAELEAQKAELEDHVTKLADGSFKLLEQRTYLLQVYNRLAATFGIEQKARRALDLVGGVGFDIEKDFPKK